ncbi:hypothetical protein COU60_00865 [Candidatus Pacearchaeota archaeon CG10_big_fil_rev_8_21_14_0_10_34_76]|nr:MAG: hypothetical protein COU60_00865 [Candidatus Pacearchaeota archaeon CG10_big_fil_rev_8_21_14_0_10_34_76]
MAKSKKNLKILELTNFTAGGCGVGKRVLRESEILSKRGHNVQVFSSNFIKGKNETCPLEDKISGVKIKRFPAKNLGGESFMSWQFEKEAIKFSPDVIIAHAYRHLHTTRALKIAKRLNAKCFLVTHAPFDRASSRNVGENFIVKIYDRLIGKPSLKKFDKVIIISNWEMPYLKKLGVDKENIFYIPNGIEDSFFSKQSKKFNNHIIYTGRVSPIKNLEIALRSLSELDTPFKFTIFGPADSLYLAKLKKIIELSGIANNVILKNRTYSHSEQIKELDNSTFFILPSLSEGMPQSLIEAMARGKIVIASNNKGNSDIISDGKNGFLFKNRDKEDLIIKLTNIISLPKSKLQKIQKEAIKTAEKYKWGELIDKLESLF